MSTTTLKSLIWAEPLLRVRRGHECCHVVTKALRLERYLGANLSGTEASLNFQKIANLASKGNGRKKGRHATTALTQVVEWSSRWKTPAAAFFMNATASRRPPHQRLWTAWATNSFARGSCMVKRPHSPTQGGDNITEGLCEINMQTREGPQTV